MRGRCWLPILPSSSIQYTPKWPIFGGIRALRAVYRYSNLGVLTDGPEMLQIFLRQFTRVMIEAGAEVGATTGTVQKNDCQDFLNCIEDFRIHPSLPFFDLCLIPAICERVLACALKIRIVGIKA